MQHLSAERIAALADEPATLAERSHLATCALCTGELGVAQRLVRLAIADVPTFEAPISSWDRLAPALRAEGLINASVAPHGGDTAVRDIRSARSQQWRYLAQAAAAVAFMMGGVAVGRASVSVDPVSPSSAVALTPVGTAPVDFTSTAEAMQVLARASDDYTRAVTYLASNDSTVTIRGRDAAMLYQARLDVLDQAVAATRAALYRAPQDPVLNQYYLTTLGARDLTLQQMGQVVPVSTSQRTKF
jgi:hypothetical protein